MATDRQHRKATDGGKASVPSTTPKSITPPPSQESQWILHILNQINSRIDEIAKTVSDSETRLRRVERWFWVLCGVLLAGGGVWAVLRLLLSTFDVTVTQKS